ncbi:MAG: tetratricopeptide repeat protein [Bacteroidota bacterium]
MNFRSILVGVVMMAGGITAVGQVQVMPDTISSPDARYTFYFAEGLRTKMLGNPDEAISFFQKCIGMNSDKGDAYYELANLYAMKGDFAGATGYARNAWKRDTKNKWYGQILIECLARLGKFEECIPVYQELQKSLPDEDAYRTGEIEMLVQSKLYGEAIKKLKGLGKSERLKRWSIVRLRDVFEETGDKKSGIRVLEKWIRENPQDFELRGVLAESYGTDGQNEKALEQYDILKRENPDNPAVSYSLGQFYYKIGKKEEALEEFTRGFRSTDVNPMIKLEIVQQLINDQKQQDKLDASVIRLIEILYETDKGQPGVDALYANYLYSEERLDEAEPIYFKLTKTNPGDFLVWQNLLFILNQKEDYERMYQVSDEAIKTFPSQGLFYLFKGLAAITKKDYATAVSTLNKGLTYPGQNPEITKQFYISLGEAQYRTGNTAEAFRNYDMILGLEPENVLVLNNYSYYLALENRDLDKALEMIERCIAKEKDNPTYLDTYAWVLFVRKEYGKALEPIKKVMAADKEPSGEVLEHYGDILYMNGMPDAAREQWIKAREKGETSEGISQKIEKGIGK